MFKKMMVTTLLILVILALALGACTQFNINTGTNYNANKKTDEETQTIALNGSRNLNFENETGGIYVTKSGGNDIKIKTKMEARGQVDEEVQAVLDEIKTSVVYEDGNLTIKAITQDGKDFWNWRSQNHRMVNVNIDFILNVPSDFETYDISLITGNIEMKKLAGNFNVSDTTGNITLQKIAMTGSNKVKLVTGNIETSLDSLEGADSLDISNVTGNILVVAPSDSDLDLEAKLTTGNIEGSLIGSSKQALGGTTVNKKLGEGSTSISVSNVTGNITLNKN